MAVPSSGTLRLASIRNELENNYYQATYTGSATGLKQASIGTYGTINTANAASDRPDGGMSNHAMSEFYNYDHDKISGNAHITYLSFSQYSSSQRNSWLLSRFHTWTTQSNNATISSATVTAICAENSRSLNSTSLSGFNSATSNSEGMFEVQVTCSGTRELYLVYVDDDGDMSVDASTGSGGSP